MKHYYEMPVDSPTGEKLSKFWQQCLRCEQAAEDYCKKMGARYYYSDPRYFAGGVICLSFPDDVKVDEQMWRRAGSDRNDNSVYWQPNVDEQQGRVEVPNRDYQLKDTFDTIYDQRVTEGENGKLYRRYVRFTRQDPPGRSDNKQRTASRGLRRAIKAEMRRRRLPVVRTEALLSLLGAATVSGDSVAALSTTPTFFTHRCRYFVALDYACPDNPDLAEITSQQYTMNQQQAELSARRQA